MKISEKLRIITREVAGQLFICDRRKSLHPTLRATWKVEGPVAAT